MAFYLSKILEKKKDRPLRALVKSCQIMRIILKTIKIQNQKKPIHINFSELSQLNYFNILQQNIKLTL